MVPLFGRSGEGWYSRQYGSRCQIAQILLPVDSRISNFQQQYESKCKGGPNTQTSQAEFEAIWEIRLQREIGWIEHTELFPLLLFHQIGSPFRLLPFG